MSHFAWLKLGKWYEQKGEIDRAITALRAGLDETPNDPLLQDALKAATLRLRAKNIADHNLNVENDAKTRQ